jgi:hypothetical protein
MWLKGAQAHAQLGREGKFRLSRQVIKSCPLTVSRSLRREKNSCELLPNLILIVLVISSFQAEVVVKPYLIWDIRFPDYVLPEEIRPYPDLG